MTIVMTSWTIWRQGTSSIVSTIGWQVSMPLVPACVISSSVVLRFTATMTFESGDKRFKRVEDEEQPNQDDDEQDDDEKFFILYVLFFHSFLKN